MADKYYVVKPQDLRVGQNFRIQTDSAAYEEYQLSEKPVYKGYIIEMQCLEIATGVPKLVLYNVNFPRDLYVSKLDGKWRAI